MKLGPNEMCHCNSNKKYKKCCFLKDELKKQEEYKKYIKGDQNELSVKMEICKNHYQEKYQDFDIIIISDYLASEPIYKKYQTIHYTNNVMMIAEKNDSNKPFFESKCGSSTDIIVMFRGSFRTFEFTNLLNVDESIDKMINTRLNGKIDNYN
jgi:hypothetical protein